MRVLCRHGHYAFYPRYAGELTEWGNAFKKTLVRSGDFFTFAELAEAPRYSIAGLAYLGADTAVTYEGQEPWEVMQANDLMYQISESKVVLKSEINITINPKLVGDYFEAQSPLIQAGSFLANGKRVLSFDGEYSERFFRLYVNQFETEE